MFNFVSEKNKLGYILLCALCSSSNIRICKDVCFFARLVSQSASFLPRVFDTSLNPLFTI